jgi:hypothetical protein
VVVSPEQPTNPSKINPIKTNKILFFTSLLLYELLNLFSPKIKIDPSQV